MAKHPRGICALCGYEGTKAALTKHLVTCPSQHDLNRGKQERGKQENIFRLRIEDNDIGIYWLDVELKASTNLLELDQFLRDIWLECCGHLSAFEINRVQYSIPYPGHDELGKSMVIRASKILRSGLVFSHEYDFGTTTSLTLKVVAEREGNFKGGLRLLSRNNPYEWHCCKCDKAATVINIEEMFETENPFYCDEHSNEDSGDYFMPVANSPRMGVCGYTGER
jgi:hypothetical protein